MKRSAFVRRSFVRHAALQLTTWLPVFALVVAAVPSVGTAQAERPTFHDRDEDPLLRGATMRGTRSNAADASERWILFDLQLADGVQFEAAHQEQLSAAMWEAADEADSSDRILESGRRGRALARSGLVVGSEVTDRDAARAAEAIDAAQLLIARIEPASRSHYKVTVLRGNPSEDPESWDRFEDERVGRAVRSVESALRAQVAAAIAAPEPDGP